MANFSRVERLLSAGAFKADHFAANLALSDPIVPALEYFLSLEHVDGFSGKLHELKTKPVGPIRSNGRRVQWASMCAELGAIYLLGCTLKIPLAGFDKCSPSAKRHRSNCDLVARINGHLTYVEVKRNASEDIQMLPELLEARLEELGSELNLSITGELLERNYDCFDIEERLATIRRHVARCHANNRNVSQEFLPLGAFRVLLSRGDIPMSFYLPLSIDQVKKKLLGPGGIGSDGEPMRPMVEQAVIKGADCLFFRMPRVAVEFCEWEEIVQKLFSPLTYKYRSHNRYVTSDHRLQGLRGIVLFASFDDFCIVSNSTAASDAWAAYLAA